MIAEDSALLREGLVRLFELAGIRVVSTASDPDGLLDAVDRHRPDLALIDVRMPPTQTDEGMRAAVVVRERWPEVAVLVLSQYVEERYAVELLAGESSGLGYLLKDRVGNFSQFLEAVRRVAAGGTALDPEVVSQLLIRSRPDSLGRLSRREREVLSLMAEGRSNAGIATGLAISESAVAKHINGIFTKLDLPAADTDHRRVLAVLRYLKV